MLGNVTSSRARRPNVSIVRTAGQANLWHVSLSVTTWVRIKGYLREVCQAEAPGEKESRSFRRTCVREEGSRVEGHDIDCHRISRGPQGRRQGDTHFRTAVVLS